MKRALTAPRYSSLFGSLFSRSRRASRSPALFTVTRSGGGRTTRASPSARPRATIVEARLKARLWTIAPLSLSLRGADLRRGGPPRIAGMEETTRPAEKGSIRRFPAPDRHHPDARRDGPDVFLSFRAEELWGGPGPSAIIAPVHGDPACHESSLLVAPGARALPALRRSRGALLGGRAPRPALSGRVDRGPRSVPVRRSRPDPRARGRAARA